jgi:hypothetical protein
MVRVLQVAAGFCGVLQGSARFVGVLFFRVLFFRVLLGSVLGGSVLGGSVRRFGSSVRFL